MSGPGTRSIAAVVNPAAAGGHAARCWQQAKTALEGSGLTITVRTTSSTGEATCLTRDLLRGGWDTVLAVGGDGTANEVLNGFFDEHHQPINAEARFGLVPC